MATIALNAQQTADAIPPDPFRRLAQETTENLLAHLGTTALASLSGTSTGFHQQLQPGIDSLATPTLAAELATLQQLQARNRRL